MSFEIIDKKTQCNKIFLNNIITENYERKDLTSTWSYDPSLKDLNILYGSLYSQGKTITECCPYSLKEHWDSLVSKHLAFQRSFLTGKVNVEETCFYDLVPEGFTKDFFSHKIKITDHVISTFPKPNNYDFLVQLSDLVSSIKQRKLNLNLSFLTKNSFNPRIRSALEKFSKINPYIHYNIFGSVTGRLSTFKNSFPILNLGKEFRHILQPNNDLLIELDYNAAELRSVLALAGQKQPEGDIHEFHLKKMKEVMTDDLTREQVKTRMFKWLYGGGGSLGISTLEEIYDKEKILENYWDGKKIINPFGREIECDHYHALSYLNQSFLSDLFLRRVLKIHDLLRETKSYVAWMVHDSLVIDLALEDKHLLPQIKKVFQETPFGNFLANVKIGKRYDLMKEV